MQVRNIIDNKLTCNQFGPSHNTLTVMVVICRDASQDSNFVFLKIQALMSDQSQDNIRIS